MQQEDLLQRLVDALGQVDCHALVTSGPGIDRGRCAGPEQRPRRRVRPARSRARSRRPGDHPRGPRHGDSFVAAGVPMVVVPIGRDQPDNAARVVYHRVGTKVSKRSSPEKFAAAVRRALADEAIRANTRRMAKRLAPDVGAPKAIERLEELAARDVRDGSSALDAPPHRFDRRGTTRRHARQQTLHR